MLSFPGHMSVRPLAWAVLVGGILMAAPAAAVPFFKANLPDFYQHQKAGPGTNVENDALMTFTPPDAEPATVPSYDTTKNWWEKDGGWCCVAAFVNSFYFLEKTYSFKSFFTRPDDESKRFGSLFDAYHKELCRSEDVTIRLRYPKGAGPDTGRPWWAQAKDEEPVVAAVPPHPALSPSKVDSSTTNRMGAGYQAEGATGKTSSWASTRAA